MCTSNEPHWFIFTITMVTFVPYSPPMMMHPNWTRHAEPACRQWRLFTALEHTSAAKMYSRRKSLFLAGRLIIAELEEMGENAPAPMQHLRRSPKSVMASAFHCKNSQKPATMG
ncbi:uncharacterized [Tachysurus ichikawai]